MLRDAANTAILFIGRYTKPTIGATRNHFIRLTHAACHGPIGMAIASTNNPKSQPATNCPNQPAAADPGRSLRHDASTTAAAVVGHLELARV